MNSVVEKVVQQDKKRLSTYKLGIQKLHSEVLQAHNIPHRQYIFNTMRHAIIESQQQCGKPLASISASTGQMPFLSPDSVYALKGRILFINT